MTALLRTRGSASEMARLFAAEPDPGLDWRETVWAGDQVPAVVVRDGQTRHLTTMSWGLPGSAFSRSVPSKQRGTLYVRDLVPAASRLRDGTELMRCLIIVECFAYPSGQTGHCTREWIGLWDEPLVAWAGLCSRDGHCAGFLACANERIAPLSDTMPRLLRPADQGPWLAGATLLALGPAYEASDHYRENLGERWSTGRTDAHEPSPRAKSA